MELRPARNPRLPILGAACFLSSFAGVAAGGEGEPSMPAGLGEAVQRAMNEADFGAVWQVGTPFEGVEAAWQAPNRAQDLRTYFSPDGVRVTPRVGGHEWSFRMSFEGFRRGELGAPAGAAEVVSEDARIEYRRHGVTEWYVNDARGVEQGFDIDARPLSELANAPLELLLALDGNMELATVGEQSVALCSADGAGRLLLSGLFTRDAAGRELPTRFERRDGGLAIVVEDLEALYPITVDPTIVNESAKLMTSGSVETALFGASVDIDGTVAVVGAPGTVFEGGNAYIFQQISQSWVLQAKLSPSGLTPGALFGNDVAASATHVAVGAPRYDSASTDSGAVYCYRNIGGVWSFGQTLQHSTPETDGHFGESLDIGSGRLLVGGPNHDTNYGADTGDLEMFIINGGAWLPGSEIHHNLLVPGASLGSSVDIAHSQRFIAGAPGMGAAFPYTFSGGGGYYFTGQGYTKAGMPDLGASVAITAEWMIAGSPGANGTGSDLGAAVMWEYDGNFFYNETFVTWGLVSGDRLGSAVAMDVVSGGAVQVLIGIPNDDLLGNNAGAVRAFRNEGGPWLYKGVARPSVNNNAARFGTCIGLSNNLAFVGAPFTAVDGKLVGSASELTWSGTSWSATEILFGTDREAGDELGFAVDIEGDLAAVGAPGESDTLRNGGAVYLFERSNGTWSQTARLSGTADAKENGRFGAALDIDPDGQSILIGAPREDGTSNSSGAVYVFSRTGDVWSQEHRMVPWETNGLSEFGACVAKLGDLAVIGSPLADGNANNSGAVYVLRSSGPIWFAEQKIEFQFGTTADGFGRAIHVSAEQIVIGAPGDDGFAPEGGAVRVYEDTGAHWTLEHTITGVTPGGELGRALAGDGNRVAMGAPGENSGMGFVYLIEQDAQGDWSSVEHFSASDGEYDDGYGEVLAMDGGRVLVGASREDVIGQQSGGAYLYEYSLGTWVETKLVQSDAAAGDLLGCGVALSGDTALVGAPSQDEGVVDAGAVYAFDVPAGPDGPIVSYGAGDGSNGGCPCGNESEPGNGEGCANSSGFGGAKLSASGSTGVGADDLEFHCVKLLPGQPALLFSGDEALSGSHFGDGLRFVGVNVKRLEVAFPDAQGDADFGPGLSGIGGWEAGDTRYVQVWYRDPNGSPCGSKFNLSNGLQVSFEQ